MSMFIAIWISLFLLPQLPDSCCFLLLELFFLLLRIRLLLIVILIVVILVTFYNHFRWSTGSRRGDTGLHGGFVSFQVLQRYYSRVRV